MRHALILAGGSGTRLWPYSTARRPKQLAPLFGERSLLDLAVERAQALLDPDRIWLQAGAQLEAAVRRAGGLRPDRILVEPSGRDTLAAVGLGCAALAARDPDAVVAVLTADHVIEPVERFRDTLERGFEVTEQHADTLVTFGVTPDHAATGFGYLELGKPLGADAREVASFREKPPADVAEEFFSAGPERFLWNSGMFVWRAETLLRALDAFCPEDAGTLRRLGAAYGTDRFAELAERDWPGIAKRSIDYGVMEPAGASAAFTVAAVPLTARWLDVGSWPALGDALGRDADGTAVGAERALVVDSRGCLVASSDPEHLVAVLGCDDLVVVHTPEATLVCPAGQAQRIKELHALVAQRHPDRA